MSIIWTREALEAATGGRAGGPIDASSVSIDTRSLQPGDLFIALVGDAGDGHMHAIAALDKGAAGAVVHPGFPLPDDPRLLHVANTQEALTGLGRYARGRFKGRTVAVTGSVGKTTTKEMLRVALSALGPTHAATASHNNHWGVPLTLSRLDPGAAFCVCEIGMNHAGEIAPLAALVQPDVAVITTIAATHIGHLGSLAAIAREKAALVESLRDGGIAILPADAAYLPDIMARAHGAGARVVRFGGIDSGAEACLTALSLGARETRLAALLEGEPIELHLMAPGRHMAMNALACLAAVKALGGDVHRAAGALEGFKPGDGRGALRPLLGGTAWLLDESYNASGVSVRASLEVMRLIPATRRVVVLGDMLELGEFARDEHLSLAPAVRESADIVYCCGHMMTDLYQILPSLIRGAAEVDSHALAPVVAAALRPGDLVLVKGSYGSRMRDVVSALAARAA